MTQALVILNGTVRGPPVVSILGFLTSVVSLGVGIILTAIGAQELYVGNAGLRSKGGAALIGGLVLVIGAVTAINVLNVPVL